MKIMHAIGAFVAGGAEKFVTDLSIEMAARGHEVVILALSNKLDAVGKSMIRELESHSVRYLQGPDHKVGVGAIFWLTKQLITEQSDILHLHTPNTELARFLSSFIYPRVAYKLIRTIHNTQVKHNYLTRLAFKINRPHVSIACGEATMHAYRSVLDDSLRLIENGVSFEWEIKTQEKTLEYKKKLNIDLDKKHYLCIGSMSGDSISTAQKAQEVLIRAWKKQNMRSEAILHLLGDGTLRTELESLSGNHSIIFHGVQNNVSEWLLACDCYVMVSRYEGLPIAAIEAISTGVHCLFTDIISLRELEPPYVSWVPVNDIDATGSELLKVLSIKTDPDVNLIEKFRSKYSIKTCVDSYLESYQ